MRSDRDRVEAWYCQICTNCGQRFATSRRHTQTCGVRCRVAQHRRGYELYTPQREFITHSVMTPPRAEWPDIKPQRTLCSSAEVIRKTRCGTRSRIHQDQAGKVLVTLPNDGKRAQPDQVSEIPVLNGGELAAALALLGLDSAPVCKSCYERARKRVVNLLAAGRRTEQDKQQIRLAWSTVQTSSPYRPRLATRVATGTVHETVTGGISNGQ